MPSCRMAEEGAVLEDGEGGTEVEPEVRGGDPEEYGLGIGNHVVEGLDALNQGIDIQGLAIRRPNRAVGIVGEIRGQVHDVLDGRIGGLALPFRLVNDIGHHQTHLVGLVAVAGHGQPGDLAAVRAPHGHGVIAAAHRDDGGLAGQDAVDVDFGIGGEGVFLAFLLLAGIGDIAAVRAPAEVLDTAEGAVRELVQYVGTAEDIQSLLDNAVAQRCDKGVVDVLHPVVPVAVHQVFGRVRIGLGQQRVGVHGTLDGAVHRAHIHDLGGIRRKGEFIDPPLDVRNLETTAQFAGFVGSLPDLATLEEEDPSAVRGPAGVRDALAVHSELRRITSFDRNGEEVADAAVVRDRGVTDAVENGLSIRGKLRIGEATEGEEDLRGHPAVLDLQVSRADVTCLWFHGFMVAREEGENRQREG